MDTIKSAGPDHAEPTSEMKPKRTLWEYYLDYADPEDREREREWNGTMDTILIFSGLFAAFLAGFIGESTKKLEGEHETLVAILTHQSYQLANRSVDPYQSMPFQPSRHAVITNYLYYTSLGLVLFSAFLAILIKAWARDFNRGFASTASPEARAMLRQGRYGEAKRLQFSLIANSVPILLFCSLAIYFAGLIVSLWDVRRGLSYLCLVPVSLSLIAYGATFLHSLISERSPFGSSMSDQMRRIFIKLRIYLPPFLRHIVFWHLAATIIWVVCELPLRLWHWFTSFVGFNLRDDRFELLSLRNASAALQESLQVAATRRRINNETLQLGQPRQHEEAYKYLLYRVSLVSQNRQVCYELLSNYVYDDENMVLKLATMLHIAFPEHYQEPITESMFMISYMQGTDYKVPLNHIINIMSSRLPLAQSNSKFDLQYIRLCITCQRLDVGTRTAWYLLNLPTVADVGPLIEASISSWIGTEGYYAGTNQRLAFDDTDVVFSDRSTNYCNLYIQWKILYRTFLPSWPQVDKTRRQLVAKHWWEAQQGLNWICQSLWLCSEDLLATIVQQAYLRRTQDQQSIQEPPQTPEKPLRRIIVNDTELSDSNTMNTQALLKHAILSILAMFYPLNSPGDADPDEMLEVIRRSLDEAPTFSRNASQGVSKLRNILGLDQVVVCDPPLDI